MSRLFNATSDRITAGTAAMPVTGTIAFWVYPTWAQTDGSNRIFFSVIKDNTFADMFILQKYTDDSLYCGWVTGGASHRAVISSYTQNQNAWNVYLMTWDDTANEVRVSLNGSEIGSHTASLVTWSTASSTRIIGNAEAGLGFDINLGGNLSHLAIWNRVLNSGERANLAAGYSPAFIDSGLQNYYPLFNMVDWKGGVTATDSGTSAATPPNVRLPERQRIQTQSPATVRASRW